MTDNAVLLERNLKYLTYIRLLMSCMLVQPVLILFYETKGLSVTEFFMIQPAFAITVVFCQLPFGYLADAWQRRMTQFIGILVNLLGCVWIFFAEGLWLAVAGVLFALGYSLSQGATGAIFYDSIANLKREDEYVKLQGKLNSHGYFALGITGSFSGVLFMLHPYAPLSIQIVLVSVACYFSYKLCEPKRTVKKKQEHFGELMRTVKHILIDHKDLKWVILTSAVIQVSFLKAYWVIQPAMNDMGYIAVFIGLAGAGSYVISGMVSTSVHRLEQLFTERALLAVSALICVMAFLIASQLNGLQMVAALYLVFVAGGTVQVVSHSMINQRVHSHIRATAISAASVVFRLLFAIVTPVFAWVLDAFSLGQALITMALMVVLVALPSLILVEKDNKTASHKINH